MRCVDCVQVSDIVCQCVQRLFNEDKAGDVTLEVLTNTACWI